MLPGVIHAREMKALLLIVSHETELCHELEKVWRSYRNYDPEHIEAYFVKADPDIEESCELVDDTLWAKTKECFFPGMTIKTLYAMEYMLPRLHEFDFVIRTNVSSFFVFDRLLAFLETLPTKECVAGHIDGGSHERATQIWTCGAGIYLSPDMVELFVANKDYILEDPFLDCTYDDVFISYFFRANNIPLRQAHYFEWFKTVNEWVKLPPIPDNVYHFRIHSAGDRLVNDLYIQRELLQKFYPLADY